MLHSIAGKLAPWELIQNYYLHMCWRVSYQEVKKEELSMVSVYTVQHFP